MNKPNIYIMSDLHFDVKKLPSNIKKKIRELNTESEVLAYKKEIYNNPKNSYSKDQIITNVESFVKLLQTNSVNNIFILAGDFFNDLSNTLILINSLEKLKITSFVVLGNHDYWAESTAQKTLEESIHVASKATENNNYCRLLMTGREYRIGNLVFIGDSGFTNFEYREWIGDRGFRFRKTNLEEIGESITDMKKVINLNTKNIIRLNKKWKKFATKKIKHLSKGDSLFIVTHWPMNDRARDPEASWWHTNANFPQENEEFTLLSNDVKEEKYWLISGHTHQNNHNRNMISVQSGYRDEKWFEQLSLSDFGKLVPVESLYQLVDRNTALSHFADKSVISERAADFLECSKKIQQLGYRRAGNSGNKEVLSVYLKNRKRYLKVVKEEMLALKSSFDGNAGYSDVLAPQLYQSRLAIEAGIEILEAGYQNNPFEFFTALTVTGYAYNKVAYLLKDMRKISVYDIIKQSMVYLTIMEIPDIDVNDIRSVKSFQGKDAAIDIANVEIKLPVINGHHLDLEDFLPMANSFNIELLGSEKAIEKRMLLENKMIKSKAKKTKEKSKKISKKNTKYQVYSKETPLADIPDIYKENRNNRVVFTVDKTSKGKRFKKHFNTLDSAITYLNDLNKLLSHFNE